MVHQSVYKRSTWPWPETSHSAQKNRKSEFPPSFWPKPIPCRTPPYSLSAQHIIPFCALLAQRPHGTPTRSSRDFGVQTPTTMMRMLIEWHQKIMKKEPVFRPFSRTCSWLNPFFPKMGCRSGSLTGDDLESHQMWTSAFHPPSLSLSLSPLSESSCLPPRPLTDPLRPSPVRSISTTAGSGAATVPSWCSWARAMSSPWWPRPGLGRGYEATEYAA